MTTTLEAINKILLLIGEREVRTRNSNPASRKAEESLTSALREFSLFNDWPFLERLVAPTAWADTIASFDDDVIRIKEATNPTFWRGFYAYVGEDLRENLPARTWRLRLGGFNQVEVPTADAESADLRFVVQTIATLPTSETADIDLPAVALDAVLKRTLAYMHLRHLDDPALAAQYSAEYEVMVQELRTKFARVPNGYNNMYRRGRV